MQVLSEGCLPCCVYGGEHLLRLLLKLPDILAGLPHARLQVQSTPLQLKFKLSGWLRRLQPHVEDDSCSVAPAHSY